MADICSHHIFHVFIFIPFILYIHCIFMPNRYVSWIKKQSKAVRSSQKIYVYVIYATLYPKISDVKQHREKETITKLLCKIGVGFFSFIFSRYSFIYYTSNIWDYVHIFPLFALFLLPKQLSYIRHILIPVL